MKGEDKKKDTLKTKDLPHHVDNGKEKARSSEPSLVSFLLVLCTVMVGTALYIVITHFIFSGVKILESHVATIILDSFIATAIAFFVIRKVYRLSEDKRIEKIRADKAEILAQTHARSLIEASLDPLVTITANGLINDANAATELVTGYARRELIGTDFSRYFTDPGRARDVYEKVLHRGSIRDFELTIRHRNGDLTPVLYNASAFTDKEKQVQGVFAAARDMTQYKEAQKEVESRNQELIAINTISRTVSQSLELKEMLDNALKELLKLSFFRGEAGGMIFLSDDRSSELSVMVHKGIPENHPCLLLPVKPGECLCGLAFSGDALIISHEKGSDERHTRRCHGLDQKADVCVPLRARNSVVGILYLALPEAFEAMTDSGADFLISIGGQIGIAIDNARLYEAVRLQHEQLRDLTYRLGEVEESERRELARELHDKVGQNLTALGISLNILKAQFSQDKPGQVRSRLDDCLDLIGETTARIRDVMVELRPSVLDDYGLLSALRWFGAQFSSRTGIQVKVEGDETMERLGVSAENALFRIAQEALTNVAKHAEASQATINLGAEDGYACLEISDNGKGFNKEKTSAERDVGTWGLLAMHERALRAGGRFRIESRIGKGTRVVVEVDR
jgi:PAS domain S-box-containing protein